MSDTPEIRVLCVGGLGCGWLTLVIAAGFAAGVMIGLLAMPAAVLGWLIMTIAMLLPSDTNQTLAFRLTGAALVIFAALLLAVSLISELSQLTHVLIDANRHPPLVWAWSAADTVALLASLAAGGLVAIGLSLRTNWHWAWTAVVGVWWMLITPCAAGIMLLAASSGKLPLTA